MQSTEVTKTKEQILKEGASKFIEVMRTPSEALEAFTYSLCDVNRVGRKESYDLTEDFCHFTMIQIIQGLITPWFISGKNMLDDMGEGIEELYQQVGYEGYLEDVVKYFLVGAEEWEDGPAETDKLCVRGLVSMIPILKEYDKYKEAQRKAA